MDDEVMRFEITDQDLEDEMSSSYGQKRYFKAQAVMRVPPCEFCFLEKNCRILLTFLPDMNSFRFISLRTASRTFILTAFSAPILPIVNFFCRNKTAIWQSKARILIFGPS